LQYKVFSQWAKLKKYANDNGIKIIGDMPIYVALDSAEVWSMPHLFQLDEDNLPIKVAGCPPDAFSKKGQLWGNPLYRWDVMKSDGYSWWIERMKIAVTLYDRLRIDHFRGFESYYTIGYGKEDAVDGAWEKGPGMQFFSRIKEVLGDIDIIAEDLGFLTPEVLKLLEDTGYPGMKVLQFAFDPHGDSAYLPHHHIRKCVLYTGTHDNDTTCGWYGKLNDEEKDFVNSYLRIKNQEEAADALVSAALASVADTAVIPMQDYMGLGSEARMNTPSTIGGNWLFRIEKEDLNNELAEKIKKLTCIYRR
jgi:4-alpha-glucanotransferase